MRKARADATTSPAAARRLFSIKPNIRIGLVGGFRPTQCGIATFTTDVYEQLGRWLPDLRVDVYAMLRQQDAPVGPEAVAIIVQDDLASYANAAERMNRDGIDVVWIQHEFGIYGGECGEYVLELIDRVAAPVMVTLHTVLADPSPKQRAIMDRMRANVSRFVVMSHAAKKLLEGVYGIPAKAIQIVEHGAPDRPHAQRDPAARPVVMTFGLIGPGKGLETAIRALPEIRKSVPGVIYRIIGATHPNLVAAEGETYRIGLKQLARDLAVDDCIEWVERFLSIDELLDALAAADIYLTPYPNLAQSTSGTLSYAVALGCAIVSTPYVHARELLADGIGRLVAAGDPAAISDAVVSLLGDPDTLARARASAYARGRRTIWSEFARRSGEIIANVLPAAAGRAAIANPVRPSANAVLGMIDDVGMLQHCRGVVPDRNHGYSIDDNARALMLMNLLGSTHDDTAVVLAAFVQHAWNAERGRFRNFMSYDRRWLEPAGSDDCNGRTIWAIGHTAHHAASPGLKQWAVELFDEASGRMTGMAAPRTMAFLVLGAEQVLRCDRDNAAARQIMAACAERFRVLPLTGDGRSARWCWPEPNVTYDNARIPQALLVLAAWMQNAAMRDAARAQLEWLARMHVTPKGYFRAIGSEGFRLSGATRPFDQQPLEAWAMIDACATAIDLGVPGEWRRLAYKAYAWYLGHNDRGIAIADPATGRCLDGLTATGVNRNTGAESLLSFSLAYQSLTRLAGGKSANVQIGERARETVGHS